MSSISIDKIYFINVETKTCEKISFNDDERNMFDSTIPTKHKIFIKFSDRMDKFLDLVLEVLKHYKELIFYFIILACLSSLYGELSSG